MVKVAPGLITIQKFVYLLNHRHYKEFVEYLESINAAMPLKLTKAIHNKLPGFDTHEELCKKIYGSFEKGPKQNFNQLASYTFRLSNVIAQNYPNYLHHNINRIEQLINEGHSQQANFIAGALLEIAERTNDFQCCIFVLGFLSQQAFIVKDIGTAIKLDTELSAILDMERTCVGIQLFTHKILSEAKNERQDLGKIRDYLLGFTGNASAVIRILSMHSYLRILLHLDPQSFEKAETHELIARLEKDLHNNSHVVFPYQLNIPGSLLQLKATLHTN